MSDAKISAPPMLPPAPAPAPKMTPSAAQGSRQHVAQVARDFEGVFAGQVVKVMMESAEVQHQFSGGAGESMFRGILAEQIGHQIAHGQGLGLSAAVEAQIIRMQEGK